MARFNSVQPYAGYISSKTKPKDNTNNNTESKKKGIKPYLKNVTETCMSDILINSPCVIENIIPERPKLRPSGFPFCNMHHYHNLAVYDSSIDEDGVHCTGDMSVHGLFFTEVGKAVHSVLQKALCLHSTWGDKLWGDFKCENTDCGAVHKHTLKPKVCSKCGDRAFEYQEVEIEFEVDISELQNLSGTKVKSSTVITRKPVILKGHIDTIICDTSTYPPSYILLDYKTTSTNAINSHLSSKPKFPYLHNVQQVNAYAALMMLKYKLNINRTALVYLTRDLISKFVVCESSFGKTEYQEAIECIRENALQVYSAEKALTLPDGPAFDYLLKTRLCGLGINKQLKNSDITYEEQFNQNHNERYAPHSVKSWKTCPFLSLCSNIDDNTTSQNTNRAYHNLRNQILIGL